MLYHLYELNQAALHPARAAAEVTALPKGALVEIDAIARV